MVTQMGEASVVLSNWGASKVAELIKDKAVLAGWSVYDSGGAGGDSSDMTTGAYWWVLKHPTDAFYILLRDLKTDWGNNSRSYWVDAQIGNNWNSTTNAWNTGGSNYNYPSHIDYYATDNSPNGFTAWLEYAFNEDQLFLYLFVDQSTQYWKRTFWGAGKLLAYDTTLLYNGNGGPYFLLGPTEPWDVGVLLGGGNTVVANKSFGYVDENSTWYMDEAILFWSDATSTSPSFTGAKIVGKLNPDLCLLASYQNNNASCGSDMQTVTVSGGAQNGFKYLISRICQRAAYGSQYYFTGGTTYRTWGLRTNL